MGAVVKREYELVLNMEAVYALIKGQCSQPILKKIEAQTGYAKVHSDRDPIGLDVQLQLQKVQSVVVDRDVGFGATADKQDDRF